MSNNICSPFKRAAVDRCCKCVVYDQRYIMCMRSFCKFFKIKDSQCRIGDSFSKNSFRILLKCCIQFFLCAVRVYESCFHAHFTNCVSEQVVSTTIQRRCTYDVITFFSNIHDSIEVCCLSGRSQHCCYSALHITDLCCYCIIRRILKSCIKISRLFKIKKSSHLITAGVTECCALYDREYTWLTVSRIVTGLYAFRFHLVITHSFISSLIAGYFYSFQLWYTS